MRGVIPLLAEPGGRNNSQTFVWPHCDRFKRLDNQPMVAGGKSVILAPLIKLFQTARRFAFAVPLPAAMRPSSHRRHRGFIAHVVRFRVQSLGRLVNPALHAWSRPAIATISNAQAAAFEHWMLPWCPP